MTGEYERRARDYINSEAGAAFAKALGELLEALQRIREANDDAALKRAHDQALAARADLELAIGVRAWRRQRIISTAAGEHPHRPVATAKGVESIYRSGGRDTEQRCANVRILQDELGTLGGGRPENLESATLILAEMGYHGPQEKPGKNSGIRAPTIRQGKDPDDGAGISITRSVTRSARKGNATVTPPSGNSAPCCISTPSARSPGQGLTRRSSRASALAWSRLSGSCLPHGPTLRMSRKTAIRTTKANSSPASCFGPRQGDADRRANCIDNSLKLRTK